LSSLGFSISAGLEAGSADRDHPLDRSAGARCDLGLDRQSYFQSCSFSSVIIFMYLQKALRVTRLAASH
jgi:hypothetical protein